MPRFSRLVFQKEITEFSHPKFRAQPNNLVSALRFKKNPDEILNLSS
jgi:hypothetical protein